MRIQMLCASALLSLALPCGAGVAHAQAWPTNPSSGYPQAYGYGYRVVPAGYAYNPYTGQYYAVANRGYAYYPQAGYRPAYPASPMVGLSTNPYHPPQEAQTTNTSTTTEEPSKDGAGTASVASPAATAIQTPSTNVPVASLPSFDEAVGAPIPKQEEPVQEHFWVDADYVIGFIKPLHFTTPLATTGSLADAHAGSLGQPGTVALFGPNVSFDMSSGVRADVGIYMDECNHWALEWIGVWIFPSHDHFTDASDGAGNPLITRPVFNSLAGREAAYADAIPGVAAGGIRIDAKSELFTTEVNGHYQFNPGKHLGLDVLAGFRFMRLAEDLNIQDQLNPTVTNAITFEGAAVSPGTMLADFDNFKTTNYFYGMQLGGKVKYDGDWFCVTAFAKTGIGATEQDVSIAGATSLSGPAGVQFAQGGILALSSNMGDHSQTRFGFVPEAGLDLAIRLTPHVRATAGYSFLYWNQVMRPTGAVDRVVNPTLVPSDVSFGTAAGGASRPQFHFNEEPYWVHQLNLGLEFHY